MIFPTDSIYSSLRHAAAAALIASLCAFDPAASSAEAAPVTHYRNPLGPEVADPFVLRDADTYYLYGTTDRSGEGFEVFVSTDLVHWTPKGMCYEKKPDSWADTDFWAPEVVKHQGRYLLHFTAKNHDSGRRSICLAAADTPLGPFRDLKAPLLPGPDGYIDSHILRDETSGTVWLYVTLENREPFGIWCARLSESLLDVTTTLAECIRHERGWEDGWVEGTFVLQHAGWYYLMYSGSAFHEPSYAVGYATARDPLGPWTKQGGKPILQASREVHGPGHHCVIESPDAKELFVLYHRHATPWSTRRLLAMDRMQFEPGVDGAGGPDRIVLPGAPSDGPVPVPSGAPARFVATTDEFETDTLDLSRWMILNEDADHWRLDKGALVIETQSGDFGRSRERFENLFLQQAPPGDWTATAEVMIAPEENYEQAFLIAWQDSDNYVKVTLEEHNGPKWFGTVELLGKNDSSPAVRRKSERSYVRLRKQGDIWQCLVSHDGTTWEQLGADWEAPLKAPFHIGVGALSPGSGAHRPARFERLEIAPGR